jgi:hypothetical protein
MSYGGGTMARWTEAPATQHAWNVARTLIPTIDTSPLGPEVGLRGEDVAQPGNAAFITSEAAEGGSGTLRRSSSPRSSTTPITTATS